ncbi:MAG: His/Gly/Thr/Pro-type tRNA ligase C-terminal domain-containing protein [Bacillus subtilis]|nr:His/Gly/Thr/Pro-type tRNA ligase C-terminal domain-containing protein [Bacillus subtilis]
MTAGLSARRYRRQDEIGTPFAVTVDYDTKENNTVTLRDRDSMKLRCRIAIDKVPVTVFALVDGSLKFVSLE